MVKTDLLKTKRNKTMSIESLYCILQGSLFKESFLVVVHQSLQGGFFSVDFGVVGAVSGLQFARLLMVHVCLHQKGSRCSALAWECLCLVLALVTFVLE